MALAYDTSTKAKVLSGTSLTFAHTCTGSNLILVVGVFYGATTDDITVTYNGVSMTKAVTQANGNSRGYLFYLNGPATGANNVVISSTGAAVTIQGMSISITGYVSQGAPEATHSTSGTSTGGSDSITTLSDNAWVIGHAALGDNSTTVTSTGTNQTNRQVYTANDNGESSLDTTGPVTPAGSVTQSWTWTTNLFFSICLLSLSPGGGGGGGAVSRRRMMVGIGQ